MRGVQAAGAVAAVMIPHATGATAIADHAEAAIALGHDVRSDSFTASVVRKLTLDDLTSTLTALDLSRAAIELHGPHDALVNAFAVWHRTPAFETK
jgi:hypothetical protein